MKKVRGRAAALPLLLFLSLAPAAPFDTALRLSPAVVLPLSADGPSPYSAGFGGTATAETELFGGFGPFLEAGASFMPMRGMDSSLLLASAGGGAGASFFPVPRLKLRFALSGGAYGAAALERGKRGLYWKTRAEAGYRFSPSAALLGGVDFSSFLDSPDPLDSFFSGVSFGLTVDFGLGSPSARSSGVTAALVQAEPVFPIVYYAYSREPFGTIEVTNGESAEIRDVEIAFRSEKLTSSEVVCGRFPLVRRGATVSVPLQAAFGERVLEFTEKTKIQGEAVVRYRLLDARMERKISAAVSFQHRNAMTWADPRAAAAFASPNDVAVQDLTKFVAGLVRERLRPDIDHAFQYGLGVFEGLRLMELAWAEDPAAPYRECRNDPARVDYLQYPFQTFAYKGGDSDDLSLLFAAALASIGLRTAFIPLRERAYAAFALDSPEQEASRFLLDRSRLAWRDGAAWVVVDVSRLREGFLAAWNAGAAAWKAASASGEDAAFFTLNDAWKRYQPSGVREMDVRIEKPREERLSLSFESAMGRFVAAEVGPRVERLKAELGPEGGTARQLNSLGILYARYSLYGEARAAFSAAADKGSRNAAVNLANVAFLLKDYAEAARLFELILADDPANRAALLGLARSRYELDAYAEADELYARAQRLDPETASQYAYLSSRVGSGAARASSAAGRGGSAPWQDGD